jgi:glutamyl-tRNA synthetase
MIGNCYQDGVGAQHAAGALRARRPFPLPFAGMTAPLRTRFAPSPTGLLHLGNVRTALFSWLAARGAGGRFVLRLEDTDAMRGHEKYARKLEDDLRWLGLDWDEGPGAGGAAGPYAQSERGPIYREYFARLEAQGHAYPCFCSEHELEISRRSAIAAGRPPRYSGRCRALTGGQVAERFARGEPATLRFRVVEGETVAFEDRVRGPQAFATSDIGDFIIRRSDGTPAFFFCNALDDALMGVTLVVRGEDHLTNTPRQMLLLRALGLPVPDYAHLALVTGQDGQPLSKRTGSKAVEELRAEGYLPLAVNNYLARLGHTCEDNALLSMAALASGFALERLHRAPSRYDEQQLRHWQKEAVLKASPDELSAWLTSYTDAHGRHLEALASPGRIALFVETVRDNIVLPDDALEWAERLFGDGAPRHEAREAIRAAGVAFFKIARDHAEQDNEDFRAYAQALSLAAHVKGKALYLPLRAALTGVTHGPGMDRLWKLLGPGRIRQRLDAAIERCRARGEPE